MSEAALSLRIAATDTASAVLNKLTTQVDSLGKSSDKAKGPLSKLQEGLGGLAKVGFEAFGIQKAFDISGEAIRGFFEDAVNSEAVHKQLEAVIESTKGVAGVTAEAADELATSLSRVSPFEDEAIVSGENMLLTFTNIGQDVFPQATETILNMSQALGQDLKSSAIQLGKALNDPISGMTALRRVGVAFTDSQVAQITELQKSGDLMGAQKIILNELGTEFGGAAKAAGETFAGKLQILQHELGNAKEAIGGRIIAALSGLLGHLNPVIEAAGDALPGALKSLGDKLEPLGSKLGDTSVYLGKVADMGKAILANDPSSFFLAMSTGFTKLTGDNTQLTNLQALTNEVFRFVHAFDNPEPIITMDYQVGSFGTTAHDTAADIRTLTGSIHDAADAVRQLKDFFKQLSAAYDDDEKAWYGLTDNTINFGGAVWNALGAVRALYDKWSELTRLPWSLQGKVPGFATGTDFAPGGSAWVGERGPELVNLPRGSQVYPNGTGPGGSTVTNVYVTVQGSVTSENNLAEKVRSVLLQRQQAITTLGFS